MARLQMAGHDLFMARRGVSREPFRRLIRRRNIAAQARRRHHRGCGAIVSKRQSFAFLNNRGDLFKFRTDCNRALQKPNVPNFIRGGTLTVCDTSHTELTKYLLAIAKIRG